MYGFEKGVGLRLLSVGGLRFRVHGLKLEKGLGFKVWGVHEHHLIYSLNS